MVESMVEYQMKRKVVHVGINFNQLSIGDKVDVKIKYMGGGTASMKKTVRQENQRPYIVIDGERLWLDKPSSGRFPEDVLSEGGMTTDFIEGVLSFASELFVVTKNCVYEVRGLRYLYTRIGTERRIKLKPLSAFSNEESIDAPLSALHTFVQCSHWKLLYKHELGHNPYQAAKELFAETGA